MMGIKKLSFRMACKFYSKISNYGYISQGLNIPQDATVFSLIQPTGKLHLGNYLGAIRSWKKLSDDKDLRRTLLFGTADLHAITIPKPNGAEFRRARKEAIASILSIGIDPKKAIIFHQSHIPQHAELNWILSTVISMGYLNRMTQWKSKANISDEHVGESIGKVKLGLFTYPVLQAADILLYKSSHVPVGDDQTQHLELTREIAKNFNKLYKINFFPMPTTVLTPAKKILNLLSPEKKMSKSDPNQNSVIYINDEPEIIQRKVKRAVTDSITSGFYYDTNNRPGVSNMINIISGVQNKSIKEVEADISSIQNHEQLKNYLAEVLIEELKAPRLEFSKYMENPGYLDEVEREGAERATKIAKKNLDDIKKIMGY